MIEMKREEDKSNEEILDELLTRTDNKIENWRQEKTEVGPEPRLIPEDHGDSSEASIYADDNSAGEKGNTIEELKNKTENMLSKIFSHMRASRLLVNSGKTMVLVFATYQKQSL